MGRREDNNRTTSCAVENDDCAIGRIRSETFRATQELAYRCVERRGDAQDEWYEDGVVDANENVYEVVEGWLLVRGIRVHRWERRERRERRDRRDRRHPGVRVTTGGGHLFGVGVGVGGWGRWIDRD